MGIAICSSNSQAHDLRLLYAAPTSSKYALPIESIELDIVVAAQSSLRAPANPRHSLNPPFMATPSEVH